MTPMMRLESKVKAANDNCLLSELTTCLSRAGILARQSRHDSSYERPTPTKNRRREVADSLVPMRAEVQGLGAWFVGEEVFSQELEDVFNIGLTDDSDSVLLRHNHLRSSTCRRQLSGPRTLLI